MTTWVFEPGHSAATFSARHMMVTRVRGHIPDARGRLEFDPEAPTRGRVEARLDARKLWTGVEARDEHLKNEDFLDVENHPEIRFEGDEVEPRGANDFRVTGDLTIRGVTRPVSLDVRCLGIWETPYWEGGENLGPVRRIGFEARTRIDRHDFGVSWNGDLARGGVVVGAEVEIVLDVEALEAGVVPGVE